MKLKPEISDKEIITVNGVSKTYLGGKFTAVDNVSLSIIEGEIVAFVGPSGCGKTTVMRMVAGLETPTTGDILVNGHEVHGPGPDRGMIFQAYTSFPWLTSRQNVEYGMKILGIPAAERRERAQKLLEEVHLGPAADKYPSELSGGMKQRVAIARTLAQNPEVLLMDEPFGALDQIRRRQMNVELQRIWSETKSTALLVTHGIDEAIFLADQVVVMHADPGRVVDIIDVPFARPRHPDLFSNPEFHALTDRISMVLHEA